MSIITEYYTSMGKRPVLTIVRQSGTGHATNVIGGLAVGMESTLLPTLVLAGGIWGSYQLAGLYGVAIAAAGIQTAKAGDKEWATAGKILTGVVAGAVIANAVSAQSATYSASYCNYGTPAYVYSPHPVYCPPPPRVIVGPAPIVCAPSPVIVYRTPVCVTPQPVVSVTFGKHYDRHDMHSGHHDHGKRHHRR